MGKLGGSIGPVLAGKEEEKKFVYCSQNDVVLDVGTVAAGIVDHWSEECPGNGDRSRGVAEQTYRRTVGVRWCFGRWSEDAEQVPRKMDRDQLCPGSARVLPSWHFIEHLVCSILGNGFRITGAGRGHGSGFGLRYGLG